jgi:hypothetical protein
MREIRPRKLMLIRAGRVTLGSRNALWERGATRYVMPGLEQRLDISAPPATVWSIIADPSYLPKLVPDMLPNEAEPQGFAS